ncbi:hypothetical protein NEIRO03_0355 [Nematocida sp. AWRm78]|nr:hypothetical protein NEIRO02_0401 [Nematocida sp. AWRm79]KAI5182704.1 hypothetical protein NEIRO03_0355 [Nematocida sp. AWRm78]
MVRLGKVLISAFFIIYIPIYSSSNTPFASVTPERRKINYYTNKSNVGFLYNIGAKKFIGTGYPENFLLGVTNTNQATPIEIVVSHGNGIGTYTEIIAVGSIRSPNEGKRTSSDFHTNVKRFDIGGGHDKILCYLYDRTSTYNRFAITPAYYKKDSAFKIVLSNLCLTLEATNSLIARPCVDDTTGGEGTDYNDRQLFKFCRQNSDDKCFY